MALVKNDKERQLVELTLIVSGIRLFNKECGKGGEGIDDCKSMQSLFVRDTTSLQKARICDSKRTLSLTRVPSQCACVSTSF